CRDLEQRLYGGHDQPDIAVIPVVLRAGLERHFHQAVLADVRLVERDGSRAVEGPASRAARAEGAPVLLEQTAQLGCGAVAIVGHALDQEERAARASPLVQDLF